jgi:hypothetical protein
MTYFTMSHRRSLQNRIKDLKTRHGKKRHDFGKGLVSPILVPVRDAKSNECEKEEEHANGSHPKGRLVT